MNYINLNQTGGFPLSTNILDAMQTAYSVFNKLGSLAGNLAIISGCEVSGSNVANGVVYINGELLEFRGGVQSANVIIKDEADTRTFEDGSSKQVIHTRYATFGNGTAVFPWVNFKRIFPTTEIQAFKDDFETRIQALENKPSPVPIGLIAIWNRPADIPIPTGWKECTDLRGRVPAGWDPNYSYEYDADGFSDPEDYKLNEPGATGGSRVHRLSKQELPEIDATFQTLEHNSFQSTGDIETYEPNPAIVAGKAVPWQHRKKRIRFGSNRNHNNMPPYRVIRFIEFVGF